MKKIKFTKMVASGNDFIIAELRAKNSGLRNLARNICDRRFGVGADGLLLLEKSKAADLKMRIFNADGSEAQMCGNGARCIALYAGKKNVNIETMAGIVESKLAAGQVRIKMTDPKDIKLNLPIIVNNRSLEVNFINTGVPHTVIFVEGLKKIDIFNLGRQIRCHRQFRPAGTNVDFVEIKDNNNLDIRTYERGVEDETLACGTGAVAAALITSIKYQLSSIKPISVHTKSGEILKVYFKRKDISFTDVWLEGKAKVVHKGVYNV